MIKNIWAKISYYFFVSMLLVVGFLCGGLKVDAASVTPDHSRLDLGLRTCSMSGRNCVNTATGYSNIPGTINTGISGSDTTSVYNFHFQTFGNNNVVFNTDNVYTLKYTFTFTFNSGSGMTYTKAWDYMRKNFKLDRVAGNTDASASGQTDDVIRSFSYTLNKSSDGSAFILTITFTPSANLKFISPYFRDKAWDPSHNGSDVTSNGFYGFQFSKVQITSVKMSYNTGSTGAINQQTEVIHQDNIEINQNISDVNDSINDDDVTNPSSSISEFEDLLPSNGVITDLISMPIRFFSSIAFRVNRTCTAYSLPFLNNTTLSLPCINIQNYLGSTIWSLIDCILTGLLVYHIGKRFISIFENFTSMKDGDVVSND